MRRLTGPGRPHPALYLFPLPAVVLYVVFFVIPTVQAVQYAATDWDGFSPDYENVGADNIVTRGKNPFGLPDDRNANSEDEGRVPYVRYQQDL